jgi:hypothetical protein
VPTQLVTFYIAAQIVERITELFSRIGDKPKDQKTDADVKMRALWLWVVSSILGVILAFVLKAGFFAASEIKGIDPTVDYLLSGIALGGGTKPIHDIISYIEKASQKKGA